MAKQDVEAVKTMLKAISDDMTILKGRQDLLTNCFKNFQEQSNHLLLAQPIIDKLQKVSQTDQAHASNSVIRENFPILLSGFNILQKEMLRLSADITFLKTHLTLGDSDDEDYLD